MTAIVIPIVTPLTVHGPFAPNDWEHCEECNHDRHRCPGCGDWLYHGTNVCLDCQQQIRRGQL